jgi:uncharacterized membrane protein
MRTKQKTDKGVAGLTILLSVVTMLFVIGLLVMIFSLMGGELRDATFDSTDATVTNESGFYLNGTTYTVDTATAQDFSAFTITTVHNASDGVVMLVGNYTAGATGTIVNATTTSPYEVNVSYTYTYNAENTATSVMNETTVGIAGVTDWFTIFIVITAMVVLILLTVIIITAIRGSGLMTAGA